MYVGLMFATFGRLLQAASQIDDSIREEITGFPEDVVFSLGIWPATDRFQVRKEHGGLRLLRKSEYQPTTLSFRFKHIAHAFAMFAFKEGTAESYTSDRIVVDGNVAYAMRIARCVDRVVTLAMPDLLARRMVKELRPLGLGAKLSAALRIYGRMIANLLMGR